MLGSLVPFFGLKSGLVKPHLAAFLRVRSVEPDCFGSTAGVVPGVGACLVDRHFRVELTQGDMSSIEVFSALLTGEELTESEDPPVDIPPPSRFLDISFLNTLCLAVLLVQPRFYLKLLCQELGETLEVENSVLGVPCYHVSMEIYENFGFRTD